VRHAHHKPATDKGFHDYPERSKRYWKRHWKNNERENEEIRKRMKGDRFSYGDIKILPGNIGYVEIKELEGNSPVKKENKNSIKLASVMDFLKNSRSIIIDLRNNGGGLMYQAATFCSYFADHPHSYFLTSTSEYRRDSAGILISMPFRDAYYTLDKINNELIKSKQIYVLASRRSFSAAELVMYKIKRFMPAVIIIGEKTSGGGNGYNYTPRNEYYQAIIPSNNEIDTTNGNYTIETIGITPDISVQADSALDVAYKSALQNHKGAIGSKILYFHHDRKKPVTEAIYLRNKFPDYTGDYRKAVIQMANGKLYMIYNDFRHIQLIPVAVDFFQADGFDFVRFKRGTNNKVYEIQIKYDDGYLERFSLRHL
jgi:hypothetical protein